MNEKEIQGNNKLIAEFMGAKFIPDWTSPIYTEPSATFDFENNHPTKTASRYWSNLLYHEDWAWLMPVVEKINHTELNGERFDMIIFKTTCHINNQDELLLESTSNNFIECVWLGVIRFIQHFNSLTLNSGK